MKPKQVRELLPIVLKQLTFTKELKNATVYLQIDNISALTYLLKMVENSKLRKDDNLQGKLNVFVE